MPTHSWASIDIVGSAITVHLGVITDLHCRSLDYAAAFFLLGDGLKDAVGVCMRQLDDFHLAIMIARVYEGDNGPVLRDILNSHLLPLAFARGHRRLAVWAFWMLNRRDLAVRTLVVRRQRTVRQTKVTFFAQTPLANMREAVQNPLIKQVGQPGQEDSSLVLLYAELRDWSLQTLRGSSAIAPILETQVRRKFHLT